jgi:sugar lactone lactonase YvrE
MTTNAELLTLQYDVFDGADVLGESPIWLPERGLIAWVDIRLGLLHTLDPVTGERSVEEHPVPLGFVLPRRGGGLVVGVGMSVVLIDPDGTRRTLVEVDEPTPGNRFNDARCDAQGRLWAGSISVPAVIGEPRVEGSCALYRIEPDGSTEVVVEGLTVSNGLGWLDEGRTLLHTDTHTQKITRYTLDVESGRLSDPQLWAEIDRKDGIPDGMTIDSEDGVWIALFGGGELRRYSPSGDVLGRYEFPVSGVTCPTFGGHDLRDLYATSATLFLSPEEIERQKVAGSLFRARPGVVGRPELAFAG